MPKRWRFGHWTVMVWRRSSSISWSGTAVLAWWWSGCLGPDLLALLQERPWQVLGLAGQLAETHHLVHRVHAPADLPDLRTVLAARIRDAGLPPHLVDFAARVLAELPDGDRLCHGDYHPGNVLLAGGRLAVIDWSAATRGVAEADHARTLLHTAARLSEGIAAERNMLLRRVQRAYRAHHALT